MTAASLLTVRFARRSRQEQKLLLATVLLFGAAHGFLRLASLARTRAWLTAIARAARAHALNAEQSGWAATTISQHLPGRHSCLIQALACQAIAENSDIAAELKIGAARAGTIVDFHAWVEQGGRVICGQAARAFSPLT